MTTSLDFSNVEVLYELAKKRPESSWVHAISIDRLLRRPGAERGVLTFSSAGESPGSGVGALPISRELETKKSLLVRLSNEKLAPREMYEKAFRTAQGMEIDTLNVLYANYLSDEASAWRYFFNKYLQSRGGWRIDLDGLNADNIFEEFRGEAGSTVVCDHGLVSVLMPVFNNEKTVAYAARSILDQTYKNFELIIIDDASEDRTEAVCIELMKADRRVRYVRNRNNLGAYVSRNMGLLMSRGKYITILDGDDWSFPERLNFQITRLKQKPETRAHLGYYMRVDERGRAVGFRKCNDFSFDGVLHKCLASLLIERSFLEEKLGYWDCVRFGADSEMYYRILKLDPKLISEDAVPLLLALDRDGSLTNSGVSALGGQLRQTYADEYMAWHRSATTANLKFSFPQSCRPFETPPAMQVREKNVRDSLSDLDLSR